VRRSTRIPKDTFSLDLHVLSPPLTFALSQDQTLQFNHGALRTTPNHSFGVCFSLDFAWLFEATWLQKTDGNIRLLLSTYYSVFKDQPCFVFGAEARSFEASELLRRLSTARLSHSQEPFSISEPPSQSSSFSTFFSTA
jgi:hypothetical protein